MFQKYDITASPNDFNFRTMVDFIESGIFRIPVFQRNYVWDIRRASKLIESIILGLPIPQIFLYEKGRDEFLVIDGQQRMMTIYFFAKMRFPRPGKRNYLREIFGREGKIPSGVFDNEEFFTDFLLKLPSLVSEEQNSLNGLSYESLDEHRNTLDIRTMRCVLIRQNLPQDDDTSMLEIFERLNTGGVNLNPMEIRATLYRSCFLEMLTRYNVDDRWRKLMGSSEPQPRMRDVEFLLRGFAMLVRGPDYVPSMTRFLDRFAKDMQTEPPENIELMELLLNSFLEMTSDFPEGTFSTTGGQLNISVFESVFSAACESGFLERSGQARPVCSERIKALKSDVEFSEAVTVRSTHTSKVRTRLQKAKKLLWE